MSSGRSAGKILRRAFEVTFLEVPARSIYVETHPELRRDELLPSEKRSRFFFFFTAPRFIARAEQR